MIADLPAWAQDVLADVASLDDDAAIDAAIELACESARRTHGPFGAIVVDHEHRLVSAGFNRVVDGRDSTAHAEIEAIRRAEQTLDTHDLGEPERAPLTLFSSCAPCVMCYGAIYWSNLDRVVAAASSEDAERLGFMEGPVTDEMWDRARQDKAITYESGARAERDPGEPFRVYEDQGGQIY